MKKLIIMGALILTIATSMVAGTLATYTITLSPIAGNVSANSFYIGASETYFPDIKLAPSEKSEWTFDVVNFKADGTINEVDTDMTITLNVAEKEGKQAIDGLHVSIYDENNRQLGTTVVMSGQMSFDIEKAFLGNTSSTQSFKLVADWKNPFAGDDVDTANAENHNETAISVTIRGTQCLH